MEHVFDIKGKNTLKVVETDNGVILILKESQNTKPLSGKPYFYIAFNALRGFFVWSAVWRDSEMDIALHSAGNCFTEETEPENISTGFNKTLLSRIEND